MKITEESMKRQRALENGQIPEPEEPQTSGPEPAPKLSEREKLKNMSRKDRIWYIWTYYKLHMLAAVIVGILIYTVASSVYRSTFTTALHCICINSRSESEVDFTPLEQDFAVWLGLGKKDLISAETAFISYGDNATDYSYANMAKISALAAARDLDILIADTESIDHYASFGGQFDLEEILPADLLSLVQDRLYYTTGEDGTAHAYAIDLSGTAFAKACGFAQQPPLLGILNNTTRIDNAVALIRYIFDPQS